MARPKIKSVTDDRRVAVYARKSKITETGKSIEIQKEKCITLACARFDVTKNEILIYEDEGKSGFYADRPQYLKMLRDIDKNKIKAVVCYKIDRISRRTIDLLNLVQQMEQKGIAFVSVSDNDIDTTTRTGKIMISLLAAIAEFERDIIAERITDNMYELAKEGRWLGGERPIGYESKKEKLVVNGKKTTVNHLKPIEEEQKTVKRLFDIFLSSGSLTGAAAALNKEGLRTKNKKEFKLIAVKNILQNPVYAAADMDMLNYFKAYDMPIWADEKDFDGKRGIMAYNKTEQTKEINTESRTLEPKYTQKSARRDIKEWVVAVGKHKGIISGAEWIKAQNIIAEIANDSSARPKAVTRALLSGLVRCSVCGNPMYVRAETGRSNPNGSPRYRYVCKDKRNKESGCKGSKDARGYELDNLVIERISKMSPNDNSFFRELLDTKNVLLLKAQETEKELNNLRKRLAQIELDIKSQTENLRAAPETVKQAIYADIEKLSSVQEEIQNRIEKIRDDVHSQDNQIADMEKAKQAILDFPKLIRSADYEGKLLLLRRILEYVIVKDDKIHIFLKGSDIGPSFTKGQDYVWRREQNSIFNAP